MSLKSMVKWRRTWACEPPQSVLVEQSDGEVRGPCLGQLLELDDLVISMPIAMLVMRSGIHFDDHRDPMLLHPGPRLLKSRLDAVGSVTRTALRPAFADLDMIHAVAVDLRGIRPVETPAWLSERRPVAREIGAVPLFPDKLSIPYNRATPNHGEHGPARDLQALIGRVVRAIAQKIMRNHDLL